MAHLAELVVGKPQLADSLSVAGVDPHDIAILEHSLTVLLLLEVPIAALQVAGLLGLRRSGTAREEQHHHQDE